MQTATPRISAKNLHATLQKEQPDLAAGRKEVREALAHLASEAAKAKAEAEAEAKEAEVAAKRARVQKAADSERVKQAAREEQVKEKVQVQEGVTAGVPEFKLPQTYFSITGFSTGVEEAGAEKLLGSEAWEHPPPSESTSPFLRGEKCFKFAGDGQDFSVEFMEGAIVIVPALTLTPMKQTPMKGTGVVCKVDNHTPIPYSSESSPL